MRRTILLFCLPLILGAATPAADPGVDQLIVQLGDLDPAVREKATRELTVLGPSARAALVKASESDDPEVASRASGILRSLPWFLPGDAPQVRNILQNHAALRPDRRLTTVVQLLNLPNNLGLDAALRLLRNETDTRLRWGIVQLMREQWSKPSEQPEVMEKRRQAVKAIQIASDDAPVLCLIAAAVQQEKPQEAVGIYRRAIDAADLRSNDDGGELERAFDAVVTSDWMKKRYDDAARVLRRKTERPDPPRVAGVPEPVADLFALHAKVGPVAGFEDDRRTFTQYLMHPPVLYAESYRLSRAGQTLVPGIMDDIAFLVGGADPRAHRDIGRYLHRNHWARPAARELEAFLAGFTPTDAMQDQIDVANTHLELGMIRGRMFQHAAAARSIEKAMALLDSIANTVTYSHGDKTGEEARNSLLAQMHGHYLQDAIERNDQAEVARRIKLVRDLPMESPELVQEVVFYLQNNNQTADADAYFNPIDKRLSDELKEDPSPNRKNSLAWFRARSHRKLDEALKLATETVAAEPNNPAYLDTLAEVNFQMGNFDQAIRLEREAMRIDPTAPELESQMRRFLRGKK